MQENVLDGDIIRDTYEYETGDRKLWLDLLCKAKRIDINFFGVLIYLRGVGVSLVKNEKFGYVIQPIIDKRGVRGWTSVEHYNKEKQYLLPYAEQLTELLKSL